MRPRVVAALLATGTSTPPQLRALATQICAASCERVAVVLGANAGSIAPAMTGLPVAIVTNVLWADGPSSAIRCAVAWALRTGCDGLLLTSCDEPLLTGDPLLTTAHVENLLAAFADSHEIAASRTLSVSAGGLASYHASSPGLPAIFHRAHFARLAALTGEATPNTVVSTSALVTTVDAPSNREAA
ncbi:MAG: hypothetical protein JWP01_2493 [Myxococcales bacterium]|nr:hypothetical protein [Myxococcales bacterium]